ncbi:hypothetical protein [Cellulomonas composti]|uniref:Uncharacterized protein n=1 Tax=Cellulomonas composti TaxID=266130 RepID=A0A511JCY3_9CELL|nr:hypothetical protein [Cellulomonas composti]GEL95834.1 hypothetical protein CCO02nite_24920 [Cellulomonas composti]
MSDYWSILGFEGLYLEDSWVLDITARPGVLEFVVDLVLRESHPRYEAPKVGEQYCHRRGVLRFEGVSSLRWEGQGSVPATDATGEQDYGSVDALRVTDDVYTVEGDFGRIVVASAPPSVEFPG